MNDFDRLDRWYDRILKLIRNRGQLTSTELFHATRGLTEAEREDIIAHWIAIGEIDKEVTKQARGRPKTVYRYVPLYEQAGRESIKMYDVTKMTTFEIEEANERRNALNEQFTSRGLYPMKLLARPKGI